MGGVADSNAKSRVAVIGGGLAGLATAVRLAEHGVAVELFEARRALGGRAGSYWDEASQSWIDHCQHVGMGCCTNLRDFFDRTGCHDAIAQERTMTFIGPGGERANLTATPLLPAPLHLSRSLSKLTYLTKAERRSLQRTLLALAKLTVSDDLAGVTFLDWLKAQGEAASAIERFWKVVIVSALSEDIDRVDLRVARKVFVDGFFRNREAYVVDLPKVSLRELYDGRVADHLRSLGVKIHLATPVQGLHRREGGYVVDFNDDVEHQETAAFDAVVVALTWRQLPRVLTKSQLEQSGAAAFIAAVDSAPITGVHLWFDREFSAQQHAVLVERLSQWMFRRGSESSNRTGEAYYQVVISASRELSSRPQQEVIDEVVADLQATLLEDTLVENTDAEPPKLLRWKLITERHAVFSPEPASEPLRPKQTTPLPKFFLAGDWTATGWPATMESAVRSGYLAAEATLAELGQPAKLLAEDLPASWLSKWLGVRD